MGKRFGKRLNGALQPKSCYKNVNFNDSTAIKPESRQKENEKKEASHCWKSAAGFLV